MKSRVYSLPGQGRIGAEPALSCRAPLGAAPCADPSRAPLCCELLRSLRTPHSALRSSAHCRFSIRRWGGKLYCRKDRTGAPRPQGLPCSGSPEQPRPGPAPVSPQRYLKGLVDISRVGWAVWVGFPVLEVSCSRPSAVPPSRPGPALPAPEGPASSRLPPLGLDLHSDV